MFRFISVLLAALLLGRTASAANTCWDAVDALEATAPGVAAGLSDIDRAELQRSLREAELARTIEDSVRCVEIVGTLNELVGTTDVARDRDRGLPPPAPSGGVTPDISVELTELAADDLVGRRVRGVLGEYVARIVEVVRDPADSTRDYAVVEAPGLDELRVVDLAVLQFDTDGAVSMPAREGVDLDAYPAYVEENYVAYDGPVVGTSR
jgi:hypothetical protein